MIGLTLSLALSNKYSVRLNKNRFSQDKRLALRAKEMLMFHLQQSHVIGIAGRAQRRDKNRSSLSFPMYVDDPLSGNEVEDC